MSQRSVLSAGQHDGSKGGVRRLGGHLAYTKARGYQVRSCAVSTCVYHAAPALCSGGASATCLSSPAANFECMQAPVVPQACQAARACFARPYHQVGLTNPCACRAAITPFLAHAAMQGNYKWMLYGDDDTVSMSSNQNCTKMTSGFHLHVLSPLVSAAQQFDRLPSYCWSTASQAADLTDNPSQQRRWTQ